MGQFYVQKGPFSYQPFKFGEFRSNFLLFHDGFDRFLRRFAINRALLQHSTVNDIELLAIFDDERIRTFIIAVYLKASRHLSWYQS